MSGRAGTWAAPRRLRAYAAILVAASVTLLLTARTPAPSDLGVPAWVTVASLLAVAAFHVESSRLLALRFRYRLRPHRALAAWALASAVLVPVPWLVLVVPVTVAHARRRDHPRLPGGLRWVITAAELVLGGVAAAAARDGASEAAASAVGSDLAGDVVALTAAGCAFLGVQALLWLAGESLRVSGVAWWNRQHRRPLAALGSEVVALLLGAVFAAVWVVGPWYALFVIAASLVIQHALLVLPLRSRLESERKLISANRTLTALVDALAAKNEELDHLVRFKTDLMGMLGHEIGNPLTSLMGYGEIGLDAADDGDLDGARAALVVVDRNAHRVAGVLTDLLHLLASEHGSLTAAPEPVLLEPRLRAAIDDLPRGRRPRLRCAPDLTVRVQPGHLDQIVANLLSNAAKYAGGATAVVVTAAADLATVEVSVVDAGPGIPEANRDRLFDRYWRASGTPGAPAGTGLGLFISRELARANGGELSHEHAQPSGSRFTLRLARDFAEPALRVA